MAEVNILQALGITLKIGQYLAEAAQELGHNFVYIFFSLCGKTSEKWGYY